MTSQSSNNLAQYNPWPHRWAVATTCATFPLIWVGGLVTTTGAGMAVPDWPNTFGYNLFLYPMSEWFYGPWDLFVEHGHRLLGATVGILAIVLVTVSLRCESRRWVQGLATLLLLAIIGQGVLGGMRVRMDARTLAMIHGCTATLVFSMAASVAVVTSRRWRENSNTPIEKARRLFPLALATAIVAYLQLVVGAQLRHVPVTGDPKVFETAVYLHLVLAGMLLIHVAWLAFAVRGCGTRWIARPTYILAVLVFVQLTLGAATWLAKYSAPAWLTGILGEFNYAIAAASPEQSAIITAHVATGSLIVAIAVTVAVRVAHAAQWSRTTHTRRSVTAVEGVA